MSAFDDDLDVFFDDFAVSALIGAAPSQKTIQVIFDEAGEEMSMNGDVITYPASCLAKTSDVKMYKKGDAITVRNRDFKLKAHPRPDGTGISRLYLQEAQ